MKRKLLFASVTFVFIILIGYMYYYKNYSNLGILENVINRNGYILTQMQEPIRLKLYIRPEWIPFENDHRLSLKEPLDNVHGTIITLDNVWNRGNDIYFSFHSRYNLCYKQGEFLYNGVFHEDGTFSWNSKIDGIKLFDNNGQSIPVYQTGAGPEADFSFGIEPEDYDTIKDGFFVEYNDFILYQYER